METDACADICFGWEVTNIQNHLKAFSLLCPFLDGCLHRTLGGNSALYRTWLFHAFFLLHFFYPIFCIRSCTSGWLREIFIEITSLRLFLLRHSPLPHTGEIPISLVWHKIWTFKFFFFFYSSQVILTATALHGRVTFTPGLLRKGPIKVVFH